MVCVMRVGLFMLCVLLSSMNVVAATGVTQEQKLKAAYLFNITKFVNWDPALSVINLCLDVEAEMMRFVEQLVEGRAVGNKKWTINVSPFDAGQSSETCNLIYLAQHVRNLSVPPQTLVVADSIAAVSGNTVLTFFIENNRLRFEVNLEALKDSNLVVSSKLLKLAKIK